MLGHRSSPTGVVIRHKAFEPPAPEISSLLPSAIHPWGQLVMSHSAKYKVGQNNERVSNSVHPMRTRAEL